MSKTKELFCRERAIFLHESLGLSYKQSYEQAEREWEKTRSDTPSMDYDDDISDLEEYYE